MLANTSTVRLQPGGPLCFSGVGTLCLTSQTLTILNNTSDISAHGSTIDFNGIISTKSECLQTINYINANTAAVDLSVDSSMIFLASASEVTINGSY